MIENPRDPREMLKKVNRRCREDPRVVVVVLVQQGEIAADRDVHDKHTHTGADLERDQTRTSSTYLTSYNRRVPKPPTRAPTHHRKTSRWRRMHGSREDAKR